MNLIEVSLLADQMARDMSYKAPDRFLEEGALMAGKSRLPEPETDRAESALQALRARMQAWRERLEEALDHTIHSSRA